MKELTDEHINALEAAKEHFGRYWKAELRTCWEKATYPHALRNIDYLLQQVRNTIGRRGLHRFRFPHQLTPESRPHLSCDNCIYQEDGRHYCQLHCITVKNMDTHTCGYHTPKR